MFNLAAHLWKLSCSNDYLFFRKNLENMQKIQSANLKKILNRAEGTVFGEKYKICKDWAVDDFQKNIPISEYKDYEVFLNRIVKGEQNVLTKSKLRRLGLTSGSSGRMKYIPFTDLLASEFSKSIHVWIYGLLQAYPNLLKGKFYFSVSPTGFPETEKHNLKIGFDTDGDYLKPWERIFANQLLIVPEWLGNVHDPEFVFYVTALRLLASKDLTLISIWNPTFFLSLMELMVQEKKSLLDDLRFGSFVKFETSISPKILKQLLVQDPNRAKELEEIMSGEWNWKKIWPKLTRMSLWTDSLAQISFQKLQSKLPHLTFEPKGVIATEGMITIPFYERRADPRHLLAFVSHFFEFLDPEGKVYLPHEVKEGFEYEVLLTTGGGLYRYRIGDRFLVTGKYQGVPELKFLGRNDDISDLVGEKLNEEFLRKELLPILQTYGLTNRNSFFRGNLTEQKLYYELVIDEEICLEEVLSLSELVETILHLNPHYEYARKMGQLDPMKLIQTRFQQNDLGRNSTSKNKFLRRPITE